MKPKLGRTQVRPQSKPEVVKVRRVYFCSNCFFFGYAKEYVHSQVFDGFGDHHDSTDYYLARCCCPDCDHDVLSVEVDGETEELLLKVSSTLSKLEKDHCSSLGDEFDLYQDSAFSRVLTYIALKRGQNVAKVSANGDREEHAPLDDVTRLALLRKFAISHRYEIELAKVIVEQDMDKVREFLEKEEEEKAQNLPCEG